MDRMKKKIGQGLNNLSNPYRGYTEKAAAVCIGHIWRPIENKRMTIYIFFVVVVVVEKNKKQNKQENFERRSFAWYVVSKTISCLLFSLRERAGSTETHEHQADWDDKYRRTDEPDLRMTLDTNLYKHSIDTRAFYFYFYFPSFLVVFKFLFVFPKTNDVNEQRPQSSRAGKRSRL